MLLFPESFVRMISTLRGCCRCGLQDSLLDVLSRMMDQDVERQKRKLHAAADADIESPAPTIESMLPAIQVGLWYTDPG